MKIAVYANCQSTAIGFMLGKLIPSAQWLRLRAVQDIKKSEYEPFMETISKADIIIHQPIGDGFVVSSDKLRQELPHKQLVSFPSVYFAGLCPQLCGLRHYSQGAINGPLGAYHDARIIRSFLKGRSATHCASDLESGDEAMLKCFAPMLDEAVSREHGLDVKCMDIVQEHYKEQNVMYTFNHPSNFLLWQMAKRICAAIGHKTSVDNDAFPKPFLNDTVSCVPEYIADHHDLSWRQPSYCKAGEQLDMQAVIDEFYEIYSHHVDFETVCRRSSTRISLPIFS
ncbi:MAG: WcbI family polysaccharide biosynthesis putative acetyltransferase [Beijerinckiaceae bacterium]|nr:WcbI family polysaccharide biosynthesis putative acetyltransferase [Beijerinckiaceae bacterium]